MASVINNPPKSHKANPARSAITITCVGCNQTDSILTHYALCGTPPEQLGRLGWIRLPLGDRAFLLCRSCQSLALHAHLARSLRRRGLLTHALDAQEVVDELESLIAARLRDRQGGTLQ